MLRNAVIAFLAVVTAGLAYAYYNQSKEMDQQVQLVSETHDKAEKDLQSLRDKLGNEERLRSAAAAIARYQRQSDRAHRARQRDNPGPPQ